mmetsp:Transcript_26604/g.75116  ORF Transcript_26604/g.75116 Transcript_26604/m.75116 type:complete len:239 (+) Transcript_26604:690-1406(+)
MRGPLPPLLRRRGPLAPRAPAPRRRRAPAAAGPAVRRARRAPPEEWRRRCCPVRTKCVSSAPRDCRALARARPRREPPDDAEPRERQACHDGLRRAGGLAAVPAPPAYCGRGGRRGGWCGKWRVPPGPGAAEPAGSVPQDRRTPRSISLVCGGRLAPGDIDRERARLGLRCELRALAARHQLQLVWLRWLLGRGGAARGRERGHPEHPVRRRRAVRAAVPALRRAPCVQEGPPARRRP